MRKVARFSFGNKYSMKKLFEKFLLEGKEPEFLISGINGIENVIDLRTNPETAIIFREDDVTEDEVKKFNSWLRQHKDSYVRLYHGTSEEFDIMKDGLLKTTTKRRNSYQSASGFVYLSIYPGSARTFGEIAYPRNNVVVYSVDIRIKELKPDLDQLYNKRSVGIECGNTLADSLIFGHGARVARKIFPYEIGVTEY